MPGNANAIFLKRDLTFKPAFADVSTNMTLYSLARLSPSSVVTCLSSTRQLKLGKEVRKHS